jgi:tetratricopeptide (TPR) repeat protein
MEPPATIPKRTRRPVEIAAIIALLSLGIWLRLTNLGNITSRSPDERIYTRQANTVLKYGNRGIRTLAAEHIRDAETRLYPPPTRVGYIWMVAAAMQLSGRMDENAGAYLSCAASIGSLVIVAIIAVRFFPGWLPFFALLFFCVSPLELAIARRAWGDTLVGFFGLILFWMTSELATRRGKRVCYVLFALAGIAEIVIKESGPVIFALYSLALLSAMVRRRDWENGLATATTVLLSTLASVFWLAYSVGGFSVLVKILLDWFNANAQNLYALEYQSGPPYLMLQALWLFVPLTVVLCVIGLSILLIQPLRKRCWALSGSTGGDSVAPATVSMLAYAALPMFLPHWLNLRYWSPLFGVMCLLSGLGGWYFAAIFSQRLPPHWARAWCVIAIGLVILAARTDYTQFQKIIVQDAIPDLSVKMVLDAGKTRNATSRELTAEDYLNLSLQYYQSQRYRECIDAAEQALKLRPDIPEAYNNIGAAYNNLGMWDEAIQAETQALRIKPDFTLARNNLEWSLSQKKTSREESPAVAK